MRRTDGLGRAGTPVDAMQASSRITQAQTLISNCTSRTATSPTGDAGH